MKMEWEPAQFFQEKPRSIPYALLVLNQPINQNAYKILKKHASFILCADGGANRFYSLMKRTGSESTELPDAVAGDMDSITADVRKHYENLNVPVLHDPDQYSTDITKCLKYLRANVERITNTLPTTSASSPKSGHAPPPSPSPSLSFSTSSSSTTAEEEEPQLDVVLLGGLGGRVDQAFSQIHHLYAAAQSTPSAAGRPRGELYLVSEESITFLLRKGNNIISTPGGRNLGPPPPPPASNLSTQNGQVNGHGYENGDTDGHDTESYFAESIGIIPVGGPSVINTRGFEWDIHDWKTEFGGQLSTSNHIRADVVEVETIVPVLFTVELAERFKYRGID